MDPQLLMYHGTTKWALKLLNRPWELLNEPTHGYCMDPGTTKETLELLNAPWNLYINPITNN